MRAWEVRRLSNENECHLKFFQVLGLWFTDGRQAQGQRLKTRQDTRLGEKMGE